MKIYIKSKRLGLSEVLIDNQDYELVSKHKWYITATKGYTHTNYAQAHYYKNGKRSVIAMHRLILGEPDGIIDHKDRNGLNNQRDNIRVVGYGLNRLNSKLNSNSATGHRNISYHLKSGKYKVQLKRMMNGVNKYIYLGAYNSLEDAISVRDKNVAFYDEPPRQFCYPCLGIIRLEYSIR